MKDNFLTALDSHIAPPTEAALAAELVTTEKTPRRTPAYVGELTRYTPRYSPRVYAETPRGTPAHGVVAEGEYVVYLGVHLGVHLGVISACISAYISA